MTELRYVYAVTRPFDGTLPEGLAGVAGAPPRLLAHDGLLAVLGDVPADDFSEEPLRARLEDLDWLTSTARAHEAVIGALTAVTSPLPLRLATVCHDDGGVRRLLDSGRERFTRCLERLDGRVEWGVKVYAREAPETPRDDTGSVGSAGSAAPKEAASGRDYLRQRLRQRNARSSILSEADTGSRRLHEELSRCAEDVRVHRLQDARLPGVPRGNVLNAAYLLPREQSEAFVEEVRRIGARSSGIRVELTGPWAPYSFADVSDPAREGSEGR
ncbi:GvpL/GvpF family gas vesicle protein [Streptomyces netropsis]|uniref:GvpL/GvpF family gas vesicle protein n=1 Tax=Streptomyces netropsis TaxID=55404 RepID=UPI0030D11085